MTHLVAALPNGLERAVRRNLASGEEVHVKLKGAWQEALVCTDRRVLIVKRGLFTGHLFGSDVFQTPYGNVASAEVNFGLFTGYLEISTGGMQNTAKSFWSREPASDPAKAPNSIGLTSRGQAALFREACGWIMGRIEEGRAPRRRHESEAPRAAAREASGPAEEIDRLWHLRKEGAMSEEEFQAAKTRILGA